MGTTTAAAQTGSGSRSDAPGEPDYRDAIGLGVAGNFAGHLEQAGEAADFASLAPRPVDAPKGLFPFYVPPGPGAGAHFLHTYPVSSTTLRLAPGGEKHQIEPEVALLCDLAYDDGGRVHSVVPRFAMAHDDCSIRRPGAKKISEKKNWGAQSKGTARGAIAIDRFESGGVLDRYRLASFLVRDGAVHEYGVDSPVTSYSYFYGRLVDWLVDRMRAQADEGPLEDVPRWIATAGAPRRALISIGATRYTELGEHTFLEAGDRAVVALYDASRYDAAGVRALAAAPPPTAPDGVSLLDQLVVAAAPQ
ncbi:MAG: DUF5718 family protein [Myxococcota bacterium]